MEFLQRGRTLARSPSEVRTQKRSEAEAVRARDMNMMNKFFISWIYVRFRRNSACGRYKSFRTVKWMDRKWAEKNQTHIANWSDLRWETSAKKSEQTPNARFFVVRPLCREPCAFDRVWLCGFESIEILIPANDFLLLCRRRQRLTRNWH